MARRPRRDEPPEDAWDPEDSDDVDGLSGADGDPGTGDGDGLEPDAHDEADRQRFASDVAYCPECGAEVHDSADICPKCFAWVTDETLARPRARRRLRGAIAWILIGSLLAGACLIGLARLVL